MVKVIKGIIARKPKDLVKLKHSTEIIFGRNIRELEKKKGHKNDKTKDRFINLNNIWNNKKDLFINKELILII